MEMYSGFSFYSLGYVAKDKLRNNNMIEVYPIELIPTVTGELSSDNTLNSSNTDMNNNNSSISVNKSNLITAKWLNIGSSNRVTVPDVCKGETVILYNFHGTDKYFWTTFYIEPDLRKTEKVVYYFSAKASSGDPDYLSKGYYLAVDTENKLMEVHTAMENGETVGYDITIDGGNGNISIVDTNGNSIVLDSTNNGLNISTNTSITMSTGDVNINTTGKTVITTKGDTVVNSSGNINMTASGTFAVNAAAYTLT